MEPQQQENRRIGIIAILVTPIGVALYIAALLASWSLVPTAWHFLVSQFTG